MAVEGGAAEAEPTRQDKAENLTFLASLVKTSKISRSEPVCRWF